MKGGIAWGRSGGRYCERIDSAYGGIKAWWRVSIVENLMSTPRIEWLFQSS